MEMFLLNSEPGQTVCLAVEDFLGVFHKFVEDFDDVSVLQLSNRMAPLMGQIRQLANMFGIHPDSKSCLLLLVF